MYAISFTGKTIELLWINLKQKDTEFPESKLLFHRLRCASFIKYFKHTRKMIPRFKPYLGIEELLAAIAPDKGSVEKFEEEFARVFDGKYALAFSYGRSALWALFKSLDIQDAEIIMPAYTCVVVAHAIVLSGNRPRFVDITLHDYNMDLNQVADAINKKTKAIVATHLFGYPLDVDRLAEIVRKAETRIGHKILVIHDCAHSFGARMERKTGLWHRQCRSFRAEHQQNDNFNFWRDDHY